MKNSSGYLLLILTLFQATSAIATPTQRPVLLFSDVVSAPNSGWNLAEPDKGAAITIWGRNFGSSRANSYITVGGVQLSSNSDYMDVWGRKGNPVPFLESITFRLNNSMNQGNTTISVTVDGVTSNSLPFNINQSAIKFVDVNGSGGSGSFESPYSTPTTFVDTMSAGDILYFREGVYDQKFDGGKSVIWIRPNKASGTALQPISFVAFPGELAHIDTLANGDRVNFNRGFQSNVSHITIAKFRVTAHLRGVWTADYNRVIANDVTGVVDHAGGDGAIHSGAQGPIIYGNSIHGGRSGDNLDHAIYLDGCQNVAGGDVGYNYIWDNNFGRGPLMVDNHQNTRCSADVYMKSNHWHHNLLSAENFKTRCLGIYDLSWDTGEANEPEPAYVYNNIFVGCGDGWNGALYHENGYALIYNNTFINSQGTSIQLFDNASDEPMLGATLINNAFIQKQGIGREAIANNGTVEGRISVDHNFYQNSSNYPSDTNAATGISGLTVNSAAYSPVILSESSSLIDAGTSIVSQLVKTDFYATKRSGSYDVGAVEFGVGETPCDPCAPTKQISCFVTKTVNGKVLTFCL